MKMPGYGIKPPGANRKGNSQLIGYTQQIPRAGAAPQRCGSFACHGKRCHLDVVRGQSYNGEAMKETLSDIKNRRSCRKYLPDMVKTEELQAVLEAATYAPTGHGSQSPLMVVVQKPELVAKLSELNARAMGAKIDPFYGAGTLVIVFQDRSNQCGLQDASSVMVTLLNAAHAVGLGSCWINRAKEMMEYPEGQELLREWGIAEKYEGVAVCVLGYAAEGGEREAKPRRPDYIKYV